MELALNKRSACMVLRDLRSRDAFDPRSQERIDLPIPDPGPDRSRWSKKLLREELPGIVLGANCRISVASPLNSERICVAGVENTLYGQGLPPKSFVRISPEIAISSPELLFLEMGSVMTPVIQALLGYELCGGFSRDPLSPRDGDVTHFIRPASSVSRLRAFLDQSRNVRGLGQSERVLGWVKDNAWSAREAIIGMLMAMPASESGYGFSDIILNDRIGVGPGATRVPDITIGRTGVHVNYDGEVHLSDRERYVDDRRRDRELAARGETVLVVTKEDLNQQGGLDRVMWLVLDAIERRGFGLMEDVRATLVDKDAAMRRQQLIWSLMPGERGRQLSRQLAEGW